jgi:hypothetical protein
MKTNSFKDHPILLQVYCVEKLVIEIGDSVDLSSKRGLRSG